MNYLLFILPCLFSGLSFSQKIFSTKEAYSADVIVFVVKNEYQADLRVFKSKNQFQPNQNKGIWYFVDNQYTADKKVYFTENQYQAALKLFFVEYEYQAGWKDKSKIHLLY